MFRKLFATICYAAFSVIRSAAVVTTGAITAVRSGVQRLLDGFTSEDLLKQGIGKVASFTARAAGNAFRAARKAIQKVQTPERKPPKQTLDGVEKSSEICARSSLTRKQSITLRLVPSTGEASMDGFGGVIDAAIETKPGAQFVGWLLTRMGPTLKSILDTISPVIVKMSPIIVAVGAVAILAYLFFPDSWVGALVEMGLIYALIQLRRTLTRRIVKQVILFTLDSAMQLTSVLWGMRCGPASLLRLYTV